MNLLRRRDGESEDHYIRRMEAVSRAALGWHCEGDIRYLVSERTESDDTMEPGVLYTDLDDDDD